jgi:CHAT domain
MTNSIRILFLSSNPKDINRIRLDEEVREVDERIRLGECRDQIELITHFAVRPHDVGQYLLRHRPHILHFSGHGSPSDGIVLEDNNGQTKLVSADALADLFATIKDNLRVVVLNACYSAPQAKGIRKVIDCTIGMEKAIKDRSAIVFSAAFYEALAFGRNIRESFGLGVNALKMECPSESSIPALLTKKGIEAAQVYLASPQSNGDRDSNSVLTQ